VTAKDAATNAGGATLTVTSTPGGPVSLSGAVDSSLINRSVTTNTVYIYSGSGVVPTGATVPFATAPANQNSGACTFSYQVVTLPDGPYTVAVSSNGTTFRGAANVTVAGATTHNFPAGFVRQVGPTRVVKLPSIAIGAASAGDVIEIDAGTYPDDNAIIGKSNLTLRGVGGRAHLVSTQNISNGKGIWVNDAQNTTVENIEFSGATVSVADGENGAGIRNEGDGFVVCNSYFHDNQNGILGGVGTVLIEYSEFDHNGQCPPTNDCSHNIYIDGGTVFTMRYSYSHRAHEGHTVKSRAMENHILYNRIMDEDGDASYEIDLPNGGRSFIIGNLIQQGPNTGNSTIINYGEEGIRADGRANEIYIVNNTVVNDKGSGAFVSLSGGPTARLINNIFVGSTGGLPAASGTVTLTSNRTGTTASAGLVNAAAFDYHLTSGSPARDTGTDPGSAAATSLVPTSQYVDPANRQDRAVVNSAIDQGAYEFQ